MGAPYEEEFKKKLVYLHIGDGWSIKGLDVQSLGILWLHTNVVAIIKRRKNESVSNQL